jgi:hypothetical protein
MDWILHFIVQNIMEMKHLKAIRKTVDMTYRMTLVQVKLTQCCTDKHHSTRHSNALHIKQGWVINTVVQTNK